MMNTGETRRRKAAGKRARLDLHNATALLDRYRSWKLDGETAITVWSEPDRRYITLTMSDAIARQETIVERIRSQIAIL